MVVAALGAFTPASPAAADVPAGTAVITVAAELTPLNLGGSATPYGVLLPSGASCPGDTAHDGYLVYSYLVPAGVSPTAVSFKTGDPSKYYGYISQGSYYGAVNTAEDTGEIVGIPPEFTWSRLTPADLFPQGVQDGHVGRRHRLCQHPRRRHQLLELGDRLRGQREGPGGLHLEGRSPGQRRRATPGATSGCGWVRHSSGWP